MGPKKKFARLGKITCDSLASRKFRRARHFKLSCVKFETKSVLGFVHHLALMSLLVVLCNAHHTAGASSQHVPGCHHIMIYIPRQHPSLLKEQVSVKVLCDVNVHTCKQVV